MGNAADVGESLDGVAVDFVDDPACGCVAGSIVGRCGGNDGLCDGGGGSGLGV